MRITHLQIRNYRGFSADCTRIPVAGDFSEGFNLFVGANRAGKTTLINAMRLAFRRDTVTSQGNTTVSGQRKDARAPVYDFHDTASPFEIRVEYERSRPGPRECATVTCKGRDEPYERSIEAADQALIAANQSTLRNRVFGPGWPRHLRDLNSIAFEGSAVTNLDLFQRPGWWDSVQEITRTFFGFAPRMPDGPIQDITDELGRPLVENGDGLAHILYLVLEIEKHDESTVFLIEEPDLYVHPGLQRQFVEYLASGPLRTTRSHQFFVTTHSPYVINAAFDLGRRPGLIDPSFFRMDFKDGQIDCQQRQHAEGWEILRHLGHRPSDVLQANGIIWVEGPSDKVYLQTWLDLYAASRSSVDGSSPIRWGLDAEILWYGGSLLAHVGAGESRFWDIATDADCERILNVARVNPNGAILMDRDTKSGKKWETKDRVKGECERLGMLVWITSKREIEGYRAKAYGDSWRGSKGKVKAADDYRAAVLLRGEPLEQVVAVSTDVVTKIGELYRKIRSWGP